jgi:hypothetical protein
MKLAVLRFLRDSPGSEALGIGYGAAYLKAAATRAITAEPFDATARMGERRADEASGSAHGLAAIAAHIEVVEQFGVRMRSFERKGRMYIEFAGFAPGARRLLIAREVKDRGRFRRRFEELRLDDLALVRQASVPELLRDFGRWQNAAWRRDTLALH